MKKQLLSAALVLLAGAPSFAQQITKVNVSGEITGNVHWVSDTGYVLNGYVYVDSNAVLTIDSGTTIFGDKASKGALIVERGAKIFANGTERFPVVFTSNEAQGSRNYGDWGGLILCGKSPTNWNADKQVEGGPRSLYGGTDPNDNSGRLSYVRIEFGGIAFSPNNEVNSLSLYAVGSGTQIDHIQTSFSGDDGIEWFGGTVNSKYIVAYKTVDDDFDNDLNFSGKNQFGVSLREPYVADAASGSKAIESDAYQGGTYSGIPFVAAQANTSVWSNLTLVGPQKTPGSTNHNTANNIAGVQIRRGSSLSVLNSIILGFPVGVLFDESAAAYGSTTANIASQSLQFRNNIIAGTAPTTGPRDVFYVKDGARNNTPTITWADTTTGNPFNPYAGPYAMLYAPANANRVYNGDNASSGGLNLTDPFSLGNPNFLPLATSPALTGANFTTSKASDPFFTPVSFVGAFGSTNWMANWTNFDPINTNYMIKRQAGVGVKDITFVNFMTVYPNPASTAASVMFDLKENADISVALYDVTGKLVSQLFKGAKGAGSHSVSADLSSLQNGFYTVRLNTAKGQKSMPLVVAH